MDGVCGEVKNPNGALSLVRKGAVLELADVVRAMADQLTKLGRGTKKSPAEFLEATPHCH